MGAELVASLAEAADGIGGRARQALQRGPADRAARDFDERPFVCVHKPRRNGIGRAEEHRIGTRHLPFEHVGNRQGRMGVACRIANDEGEAGPGAEHHDGYSRGVVGRSLHVMVVVLGDLGRSPRMQYHALALARSGATVTLIGELGSSLPTFLGHPGIQVRQIPSSRGAAGVLAAAWHLWRAARQAPAPDVILVQTPPAIPTLLVAWRIARRHRSRLVFDWHNLGWTLLAHRRGRVDAFTWLARTIEYTCAPLADAHLTVSNALAEVLRSSTGVQSVTVLRDRPWPSQARPVEHASVMRVRQSVYAAAGVEPGCQPAIVLCPTSWTSDERIDVLPEVADRLESMWTDAGPRDGVVLVISGDGPGRSAFEARVRERVARRVRLCTIFVAADDYPALVRAAHVGLSLHVSSSRLDLPMKICDLFAAGVPVCAWDFGPVLRELVRPDVDARVCDSVESLAAAFDDLLRTWPVATPALETLRVGAADAQRGPDWVSGWNAEARHVLLEPSAASAGAPGVR